MMARKKSQTTRKAPQSDEPEPAWQQAKNKRYADITIEEVRAKARVCDAMAEQLRAVADLMSKQGVRHLTVEGGMKMDRGVDLVDRFIRNLETALIRCREALSRTGRAKR